MSIDAFADLVLGGCCVGCGVGGRSLCPPCRRALTPRPRLCWPIPTPAGLVPPVAAAEYDGVAKAAVLALKEHGRLGLARVLGAALACSVRALPVRAGVPLVLVPVPSRAASVRARGYDSTWLLTRTAARRLQACGREVSAIRLLHTRAGLLDQAGLDAAERAANLDRALWVPDRGLQRLARRRRRGLVVVCDDVITTGATAREAQRALESVGLEVAGLAAVAATVRRLRDVDERAGATT